MSTVFAQVGVAIDDALTASGSSQTNATVINRNGNVTVVTVINPDGNGVGTSKGVVLPSDAQIGDVIEVYSDNSTFNGGFTVYPESGANMDSDSSGGGTPVQRRAILRRTASAQWRTITIQ